MKESRGKDFSKKGSEGGREKKDFSRDKKSSFSGEKKSFSGSKPAKPRFNDDKKSSFDGEKKSYSSSRTSKPKFNDDRKKSFDGEKKSFSDRKSSKPRFGDDKKNGFDGEKKSYSSNRTFKPKFNDDKKRSFDGDKKSYSSSSRTSKSRFGDDNKSSGYDKERKSFLGGRTSKPRDSDNEENFESKRPYNKTEGGFKKEYGNKKFDSKPRRSYDKDSSEGGEKRPYQKRSFDGAKKPFNKRRSEDGEREPSFSDNFEYKKHYKPNRTQILEKEGDGLIRLNKFIANSGVCSRREADELIASGVVKVNGEIVTELGYKIKPEDRVHFGDRLIRGEKPVYILLNKPKDFITTSKDPQNRRTVLDLLTTVKERVFPVGRLDRNTTGLLLLTNDGDLAEKLTHPRKNVEKIYHVELDKKLTEKDFKEFEAGVELEDGFFKPDEIAYVEGENKSHVGVKLHSGKNRIVRRFFETLNYKVIKLDRVVYAGLTKKGLPRGKYRPLEDEEVAFLKRK